MDQSQNKYIGQLLDDRYELLEVIGSGGMSVVYKALDYRLNRYVAIKMLREEIFSDPELKAQFQAEAQAVIGIGVCYSGVVGVRVTRVMNGRRWMTYNRSRMTPVIAITARLGRCLGY